MRNFTSLLILCLSFAVPACGKKSDATSRPLETPQGPDRNRVFIPPILPGDYEDPGKGEAITMPAGSEGLLNQVAIQVEEIDSDPLNREVPYSYADHITVGVKVSVTSYVEHLSLRVEPSRFTLEDGDGRQMPQRVSHRKDPVLETTYLKTGESTSGWLTFLVPQSQTEFVLRSSLRRDPPVAITISVGSKGK